MKKFISRILGSTHKRILAGATIALAVALPAAVSASQAQNVQIEAQTYVANYTAGDTSWSKSSVNATYDQVVKIDVTYDNDEAAGSGKTANNLRVKINIPSAAGETQNVTTTTSADNSNAVNGSVKVNLDRSDAYLQYIPGSAVWEHAVSANSNQTTETSISDDVVDNSNGLVLENENPCQAGSVVVEARVMVPGVEVVKKVEKSTQTNAWAQQNTANPGDTLKYEIYYKNTGNTVEKNVLVRDNLPPHVTLVPGTTELYNATYQSGKAVTNDDIINGGLVIGNYGAGADAYVTFEAKVDDASKLTCGNNEFRNVAGVQPEGMNWYQNTAVTDVMDQCTPNTPTYACTAFAITKGDNRTVTVSKFATTAAGGATFKDAVIDWGDQSAQLSTTSPQGQQYQYANDGSYTINATAHFDVNGKDVTASCPAQTVSYSTPTTPVSTPPSQLPNTGAGNVLGLFAAAAVAGFVGFRLFLSRRLARR